VVQGSITREKGISFLPSPKRFGAAHNAQVCAVTKIITMKNINTGKDIETNVPETSASNNANVGETSTTETKIEETGPSSSIEDHDRQKRLLAAMAKKRENGKGKKGTSAKNSTKSKKADKPAVEKESKVTLASKIDVIVKRGGKWATMIAKANDAAKELKSPMKFTAGTVRAHINYRIKTQKKADFLGKLVMTADGVVAKAKVAEKEPAVA
jgi:hypothetical protein